MTTDAAPQGDPPRFARLVGEVVAFEDAAGWGTLRTDEGVEVFFHCTQITDGSRTVPVGTAVTAEVRPVGLGRWEATNIERRGGPAPR